MRYKTNWAIVPQLATGIYSRVIIHSKHKNMRLSVWVTALDSWCPRHGWLGCFFLTQRDNVGLCHLLGIVFVTLSNIVPLWIYDVFRNRFTTNATRRQLIVRHDNDVIMGTIASQITSLTIVYSIVYSDADQRKHQSSASLAFVWGIHRGPVNSPHKWPVTRNMFPFDDVIVA